MHLNLPQLLIIQPYQHTVPLFINPQGSVFGLGIGFALALLEKEGSPPSVCSEASSFSASCFLVVSIPKLA